MVEPIALRQLPLVSFRLFIHQIKVGANKDFIREEWSFFTSEVDGFQGCRVDHIQLTATC